MIKDNDNEPINMTSMDHSCLSLPLCFYVAMAPLEWAELSKEVGEMLSRHSPWVCVVWVPHVAHVYRKLVSVSGI